MQRLRVLAHVRQQVGHVARGLRQAAGRVEAVVEGDAHEAGGGRQLAVGQVDAHALRLRSRRHRAAVHEDDRGPTLAGLEAGRGVDVHLEASLAGRLVDERAADGHRVHSGGRDGPRAS